MMKLHSAKRRAMLLIDDDGYVFDPRIVQRKCPQLERGKLTAVRGIIVHQTGGASRESALTSYSRPKANGAHFLIDLDGTIYQTASLFRQTLHVGRLRARCLAEHRCSPVETRALKRFSPGAHHRGEMAKSYPDRYPANHDSIGIEIVGAFNVPKGQDAGEYGVYESVNPKQNESLRWLVHKLTSTFRVPMSEVFRHPTVSYKNRTEAASASW